MIARTTVQTAMPTIYHWWVVLSRRTEITPEHLVAVKALAVAVVVIQLREVLYPLPKFVLLVMLPVFFLPFLLAWSAYTDESVFDLVRRNLTFIPAPHSEEGSRGEAAPTGTYTLIALNVLAFIAVNTVPNPAPDTTMGYLVFPPHEPGLLASSVSLLTSMFSHADFGHLWGNMLFLWGVGSVLERRIGRSRFLNFYILTGIVATIVSTMIYEEAWGRVHLLGASGAISGIMGVVAVRCYFTRMVLPIPIFGLAPVGIKLRMSSLVLMGLFFFSDLDAGVEQLQDASVDNVAHWAHLAGMVAGAVMAMLLRLGHEAVEEKRIATGILSLEEGIGLDEGEESLRAAIAANPQNLEAKLALARMRSRRWSERSGEAARLYQDVMAQSITTDPELAATAFLEYLRKYRRLLDPSLHLRLSLLLYRLRDLGAAARGLQLLADADTIPPDIREKAIYRCARILDEMGLDDVGRDYYRHFAALYPRSPLLPKVFARLGIHLAPKKPC